MCNRAEYWRPACLEVNAVAEEVRNRVDDKQAQGWAGRVLNEVLHTPQPLIQIFPCGNVPLHIDVVKGLPAPTVPACIMAEWTTRWVHLETNIRGKVHKGERSEIYMIH